MELSGDFEGGGAEWEQVGLPVALGGKRTARCVSNSGFTPCAQGRKVHDALFTRPWARVG